MFIIFGILAKVKCLIYNLILDFQTNNAVFERILPTKRLKKLSKDVDLTFENVGNLLRVSHGNGNREVSD